MAWHRSCGGISTNIKGDRASEIIWTASIGGSPGSPADKAGINGGDNLKVIDGVEIPIGGDVIVRMDGSPIRDLNDFRNYLGNKQVGDNLQFTLATTDDNIRNVDAKLEARPA